jgi:RNA polymerase sigma-70 factor, ECF subfamily
MSRYSYRDFGVHEGHERNNRINLYYNTYMEKHDHYTDEQLVELVRKQDTEMYRELVMRYEAKLIKYATYLIRDEHIAKDAVQESFIKAYVNLQSFDSRKKFSSWLYRIVHNETINAVKKYKKEIPMSEHFEKADEGNIEEDFGTTEIQKRTQKCLESMPTLYTEPLILYYMEDRSYEEISDILRLPMGTVATRINRAKVIMKKICEKNK